MKKRHQIISLLANRKPASEEDRKAIISFCKKKLINNIYFKGSVAPDDQGLEPITLEQFAEWYDTKHYIPGEVIADGNGSVFLITHFIEGQSISKAHIDAQKILSTDPVIVDRCDTSREASFEEKLALQRAMSGADLNWNPHENKLMGRSIPGKGAYVSMWVLEDRVGLGILKEVDSDGNLVLYCFINGQNTAVPDEGYTLGPSDDYTVKKAILSERSEIIGKLNEINLRWAGRLMRFEPLNLRKKKGTYYHYITSCGQIRKAAENGKFIDSRRYRVGNYFHTPEEATLFLNHIIMERNRFLTGNLKLD